MNVNTKEIACIILEATATKTFNSSKDEPQLDSNKGKVLKQILKAILYLIYRGLKKTKSKSVKIKAACKSYLLRGGLSKLIESRKMIKNHLEGIFHLRNYFHRNKEF